jgi:hypothetical protein
VSRGYYAHSERNFDLDLGWQWRWWRPATRGELEDVSTSIMDGQSGDDSAAAAPHGVEDQRPVSAGGARCSHRSTSAARPAGGRLRCSSGGGWRGLAGVARPFVFIRFALWVARKSWLPQNFLRWMKPPKPPLSPAKPRPTFKPQQPARPSSACSSPSYPSRHGPSSRRAPCRYGP